MRTLFCLLTSGITALTILSVYVLKDFVHMTTAKDSQQPNSGECGCCGTFELIETSILGITLECECQKEKGDYQWSYIVQFCCICNIESMGEAMHFLV